MSANKQFVAIFFFFSFTARKVDFGRHANDGEERSYGFGYTNDDDDGEYASNGEFVCLFVCLLVCLFR